MKFTDKRVFILVLVILLNLNFVYSFALIETTGTGSPFYYSPVSSCAAENTILKFSSSSNAHVELPSEDNYQNSLCYSGSVSGSSDPHLCSTNPSNLILKISSDVNAHSQTSSSDGVYSTQVCYNNLNCAYSTSSCPQNTYCLLKLSSTENAHVAKCSDSYYPIKVCCGTSVLPVECGDGACVEGETFASCAEDCFQPLGFCNNDGNCDIGETPQNCLQDCGSLLCGNGFCNPGETFSTCSSDCPQSLCGNGLCGLGETNTNCELDCPPTPSAVCGNNLCESTETNSNCVQDCQSCSSTTNCNSGEECVNGFCNQISCSQTNTCAQGQTCSNGICQVTECSSSNPCFTGQVCDSNNNCQTANLCTNTNCPSGQTCQSGVCVQQSCIEDSSCSSGSYCGNNGLCQPIPKSCSSAGGIVCKSPAICNSETSKLYADSIELGCCISKGTGNPGCTSAAIYIPTLGSSVKFEKSCTASGQTQVIVKEASCTNPSTDNNFCKVNTNSYSALGITSNPYIDYNDYSCNTELTGDSAQPVYGYGILSLLLTLGIIGIYYILRKKL